MPHVLAAEGGYQAFELHGGEWAILAFSGLTALLAIAVGFFLRSGGPGLRPGHAEDDRDRHRDPGGALAYLKRQFRTIVVILVPLAIVVFVTSVEVLKPDGDGGPLLRRVGPVPHPGLHRRRHHVRPHRLHRHDARHPGQRAHRGGRQDRLACPTALKVAFRTGGVAGMFTVGLGLLGATLIIIVFQNTSSAILVGFGFGGSLLALFLRVGGGIFTKAADVGADLVGKVEAGIPEDDPRNPATIADNVGDNVGDCAGMAADLFESYEVTLVASIILGVAAFNAIGANPALGLVFPLAARAIGVRRLHRRRVRGAGQARARPTPSSPSTGASSPPASSPSSAPLSWPSSTWATTPTRRLSNVGWSCFGAVVIGLVLAQVVSRLTEYFTGTEYGPVKEIAESSRTGPATVVLSGTSVGPRVLGVRHHRHRHRPRRCASALGGGNLQFSLYLVALTGMGMLATTGVVVSEDTFGPVSDNAAGIAEMSGEFHGEPERIMVSLDAVGNTTKAVTKGFAIGSAVIAAVALFASYIETIANETLSTEVVERLNGTARASSTPSRSTWPTRRCSSAC